MRTQFEFRPSADRPPRDWRERIPAGFVIRRIDADVAVRLQSDLVAAGGVPWFDTVWGGIPAFLEKGFGFVAEWTGDDAPVLASNCRAWGVREGVAPLKVSTRVRFRGQALATLVCAAFLEHCEQCGLTPEYSCEAENIASAALALKLGFVPVTVQDS